MKTAVAVLKKVEIEVLIVGQRITGVRPDPAKVPLGAEVSWMSMSPEPFAIVFADPFFQHSIPHINAVHRFTAANLGRFKYSVVLENNPSIRLDPEIEVEPPPPVRTGGG